jgi:hypothetical protein
MKDFAVMLLWILEPSENTNVLLSFKEKKRTETRRLFCPNLYTYIWNRITLLSTEQFKNWNKLNVILSPPFMTIGLNWKL